MDPGEALLAAADFAMRETALFAAAPFLLLGISDLAVDMVWIAYSLRRLVSRRVKAPAADELPPPAKPGPLAVFVPPWDEAAVIRTMLRHTLARFGQGDYRIYVGCYPNDPATIEEVRRVRDPRVRLVIGRCRGRQPSGLPRRRRSGCPATSPSQWTGACAWPERPRRAAGPRSPSPQIFNGAMLPRRGLSR